MSGYTTTPNFGLRKPTVGGDDDAWGGDLNFNSDTIDNTLASKTYTDARRRRWLAAVTTPIPNVGASTSEEVAIVWTLPAGLLANVGDVVHVVVKVACAGTTDTKQARVRFTSQANGLGGSPLPATGNAAATTGMIIEGWVMKTASNAQRFWYCSVQATNSVVNGEGASALTDSGALYLGLTLQNATAATPGSITISSAFAEYLPAV